MDASWKKYLNWYSQFLGDSNFCEVEVNSSYNKIQDGGVILDILNQ